MTQDSLTTNVPASAEEASESPSSPAPRQHRRRRRRLGGKRLKDAALRLTFRMADATRLVPSPLARVAVRGLTSSARLASKLPFTPARVTAGHMAQIVGGDATASSVLNGFFERLAVAADLYLALHREGADAILPRMSIEPKSRKIFVETLDNHGGAILVVTHCIGGVLSLATLAREVPVTMLYRGAPNPRRDKIQTRFLEGLGIHHHAIRKQSEMSIARAIMAGLKRKGYVLGATDINRNTPDSLPATMFGEPVRLPGWPARFAVRRKVPIVSAMAVIEDGKVILCCSEPVLETDPEAATAGWATALEQIIRRSPSDWGFMFDKRWRPVLRSAAEKQQG